MEPSDNRKQFVAEAVAHYRNQYKRLLHYENIKDEPTRNYLSKLQLGSWSNKNRIIGSMQSMKYHHAAVKTTMVTTCFKVSRDGVSSIYAYLYTKYNPDEPESAEHAYVCTGPTFQSHDGEYRARFIRWSQFLDIFDVYADKLAPIEQLVVNKLSAGELEFNAEFFYPDDFVQRAWVEEQVNEKRLPIKFFMMCWYADYLRIHLKTMENHINPAYQHIIYDPDDESVLHQLYDTKNTHPYWHIHARMTQYFESVKDVGQALLQPQVGQKIFPLTIIESIRLDDIHFNVWREMYINNITSNLALNLISPNFPFINNWFYIQNSAASLFDNPAMHTKHKHGELAEEITTQLRATNKYNYANGKIKNGPISNKFERLSRTIQRSVLYADSNIRLTNLSICVTSEYTGRTVRDLPVLIASGDIGYGMDLIFTNIEIFTKHMFEFIYGFYTMNVKVGVIHGDMHLNNATIQLLYNMESVDVPESRPHIVYVIDDTTYVFRHCGYTSVIIDFSQALLGDYKKVESEFGARFAEVYFIQQNARAMHMLLNIFPNLIAPNLEIVEALLRDNFPLMFKIITAIDTFVLMRNIHAMITIDSAFGRDGIKVAPGAVKLLAKIIEEAENLIVNDITRAIEGKLSDEDDIEWPNLLILTKLFAANELTPTKMADPAINVVDVFNANCDVVYDIDDYDSWGPLLSMEKEMEIGAKYGEDAYGGIVEWRAITFGNEQDRIDQLRAPYIAQEKNITHAESWMLV